MNVFKSCDFGEFHSKPQLMRCAVVVLHLFFAVRLVIVHVNPLLSSRDDMHRLTEVRHGVVWEWKRGWRKIIKESGTSSLSRRNKIELYVLWIFKTKKRCMMNDVKDLLIVCIIHCWTANKMLSRNSKYIVHSPYMRDQCRVFQQIYIKRSYARLIHLILLFFVRFFMIAAKINIFFSASWHHSDVSI